MIEGLDVEIWGQRARRVKAVLVTSENRNAILLWLGFTQDEIDAGLGGIVATLEPGDGIVLTDGGNVEVDDGDGGTRLTPKVGNFTRVAASAVDHLYRRPPVEVEASSWYTILDQAEALDSQPPVEG